MSELSEEHKDLIYTELVKIEETLNKLIVQTPTGEVRNKLTEMNILAMDLESDLID